MNYLLPRDVIRAVEREKITGLAAVPPLWVQLAQLDWPESISEHLRYITNSGGHMPKPTLDALRARSPKTMPYLMYGLTEAFRSTYLPPDQIDIRPDSMGKAIPNAEILVVHEDGTPCAPGEPGELVHRGVHVALGYWNDPEKTAERYKPAPGQLGGLVIPELAVWSGDPRSKSLIVRGQAQLLQNVTVGQDIERVRRLFEALETQSTFMRLLDATHTAEGVQIFIGAENQLFELSGCSLIVAPFRNMRSEVVGAIGVVGPSRVNYGKVIPMVDYTAKVMTRLLFPS
jgi:acyl-CoA synthetase (AMP-forming)/AMP-acid ligase II